MERGTETPTYKWYLATEGVAHLIRSDFDKRKDFVRVTEFPNGDKLSRDCLWYKNNIGDEMFLEWRPEVRRFLVSCHESMDPLIRDYDLEPYSIF